MPERFELFRLSLVRREANPDLFDTDWKLSREEFIRLVFSEEYKFTTYGTAFHFVPEYPQPLSDAIFGRIGRPRVVDENLPPEQGLIESNPERWKAAIIAIDPRHHEDGQKIAVQIEKRVGSPLTLISGLVRAINEAKPRGPFTFAVKPIFDGGSFWDFAAKHEGHLTRVSFELIAPNMFGIDDTVDEEMKAFRDREHARSVTISLKNQDGTLDVNTERVRQSVEYAERGGGAIRAKAKGNHSYSSSRKPSTVTIDEDELDHEPLIVRIARRFSELLRP